MTVKIAKVGPTFSVPATVYLQGDGNALIAHQFHVVFRRVKTSEREELGKLAADSNLTNTDLLDRVVVGWSGMSGESGEEVPYSHSARAAAEEEYSGVEMAMAVAFWDHSFINQRDAAAKNSVAPSAGT